MPTAVGFAVEAHEQAAMEYGGLLTLGPHHSTLLTHQDEDETIELEIVFDDLLEEHEARRLAAEIYARIREATQLPAVEPPPITTVHQFGMAIDRASDFITEAEDLLEQHRYEMAVCAMHTVCEIVIYETVRHALIAGDPARMVVSPTPKTRWSLMDRFGRMLFFAATGRRPWDDDWWTRYEAHVTRRNKAVHRGVPITQFRGRRVA
jgi:hypothetical protein